MLVANCSVMVSAQCEARRRGPWCVGGHGEVDEAAHPILRVGRLALVVFARAFEADQDEVSDVTACLPQLLGECDALILVGDVPDHALEVQAADVLGQGAALALGFKGGEAGEHSTW